MIAKYFKYTLNFNEPGGTSRGVMLTRDSWFIQVFDESNPQTFGIGECAPLKGLSIDDVPNYDSLLQKVCENIDEPENLEDIFKANPAIYFGYEMAIADLKNGGKREYMRSPFIRTQTPIKINGLIWMGDKQLMLKRIKEKLELGFSCLKMKIGAIDFQEELDLLGFIRNEFSDEELELRVDANGAFGADEALEKLNKLHEFGIHSIEQPIKAGQRQEMARLCEETPISIALDEELIGITSTEGKADLIETIQPQYIILKPSLVGGFKGSQEWINAAGEFGVPWWATSALESNIGLNAIAQWTATYYNPLPQGLGTGQVFTNNFDSPAKLKGDLLFHDGETTWNIDPIFQETVLS